ncbi:hypothetical protein [Mucilaginibacter sp. AK015]|uniref:hypothetical protein n=1 Tax=Mucilaginibacter sp. AK015 TaxID=2723072 RepID=UPI0016073EBF|nr:hypothetical protein [Mucilaginibacter sp. AK015]MBB5394657.1 hypothetical protein [Mucilaginibacter sp. AK015]
MQRLTTLTIQYYRSLLLYNITFTFLCIVLVGFGAGINLVSIFFSKIIGFLSATGLHYYSSANTYFYYRNAGITIRRLYFYAFLVDLAAFILIALLINLCSRLF